MPRTCKLFLIVLLAASSLMLEQLPSEAGDKQRETDLEIELSFWESVKDSRDPKMFELYLNKFPNGKFSDLARALIERHGGQPSQPSISDAEEHFERGNENRKKKKYDLAIKHYTKAIKLNPKHARALVGRGVSYRITGKYDRAIADFDKAIAIKPKYSWALAQRGEAHRQTGRYDPAIVDFNKAIEINPKYAWAIGSRGQAYLQNKQYERAIADFDEVIKIEPNYAWAFANRGQAFIKNGKFARAIADFDQVIEINPKYSTVLLQRASVNARIGDWQKAFKDYNAVQKTDPGLVARHVGLLSAHKALESVRDKVPTNAESSIVKVRVSTKGKNGSEALRWGEGLFISEQGHVVLPSHLLDKPGSITVITADKKQLSAKVVGKDTRTDLALLHVNNHEKFPFARLANGPPVMGSLVFLYGSSRYLGEKFSPGIVSHLARDTSAGPFGTIHINEIAVGRFGGGPAFNENGDVIGLMISRYSRNQNQPTGISFYVPADQIRLVTDALITKGRVLRGWFGARIQNVTKFLAEAFGLKGINGAVISALIKDGSAEKAGLKAGDIIFSVNGRKVKDARDFVNRIAIYPPGTKLDVVFWRDGTEKSVVVELEEFPRRPAKQEKNKSKD